jgi:hypothetical protein
MCWYVGYNLDEPLPDHSSLTRIRQRFGVQVFRRFFEVILEQCRQARLIWGKEVYMDATKVEANAAVDSRTPRFAVEEHLAQLFSDPAADEGPAGAMPLQIPTPLSEATKETLAATNAQRYDWIASVGHPNRVEMHGRYRRMADFQVSTADPDATLMPLKGGGSHLGYHTHYVVDGGKRRLILNVLVTPSEVMEN